jgi:hypothetical protein
LPGRILHIIRHGSVHQIAQRERDFQVEVVVAELGTECTDVDMPAEPAIGNRRRIDVHTMYTIEIAVVQSVKLLRSAKPGKQAKQPIARVSDSFRNTG